MPYWQLFYHLVWSTKNRESLLTPEVEPLVYDLLRSKAIGLGATVFAVGGTENHVHLVAAVPPSLAIARFVGQVKGVASARFNKEMHPTPLCWQEEYGAFSFDAKRLPNVIAYVDNQKQHHAENKLIPVLERITGGGVMLLQETSPAYLTNYQGWWDENCSAGQDIQP